MRRAKQFIYGSFYFAIWFGLFFGIYIRFFKLPPSCFDTVQNQNEEGIDCDGVCAQVCLPPDLHQIVTTDVRVLPIDASSNAVSVIVKIQNQNTMLAVKGFRYTLDLYDTIGAPVDSISGSSYIYAGEVKYLVFPKIVPPPDKVIADGTLSARVMLPAWTRASDFQKPTLFVKTHETSVIPGENAIAVNGTLFDRDTVPLDNMLVVALLYDTRHMLVGVSQTQVDSIAPDEEVPFRMLHPYIPNLDLNATEVFVYAVR